MRLLYSVECSSLPLFLNIFFSTDFAVVHPISLNFFLAAIRRLDFTMADHEFTRFLLSNRICEEHVKSNTVNPTQMHVQNLILHNLIQKSNVLQTMVEDSECENISIDEGEFVFSYKKYDSLTLSDVTSGFDIETDTAIQIAFGIHDESSSTIEAADKLECKEYLQMAIARWISEEAPFPATASMTSEIIFCSELMKRWTIKINKCIKYKQDETLRRMWLPHVSNMGMLWKNVRDLNCAEVLVEKQVAPPPSCVCRMIEDDMLEILEMCLERRMIDVNGSLSNGKSFLLCAIQQNKHAAVKLFLHYGADATQHVNGMSPLACADCINAYKIYNTLLKNLDESNGRNVTRQV